VKEPRRLAIDDTMILPPAKDPASVQVFRGPNLVGPSKMDALPDRLAGPVILKVGDKITTDHIMPAGQLAIYRSNVPKYAQYVFSRVDADFAKRASAARDAHEAGFIVGGESYGQGSSREHAALCPRFLGIRAVLAKSIERIHQANLVNFGILPLTFAGAANAEKVQQGDVLAIDDLHAAVAGRDTLTITNVTRGTSFDVRLAASERERKILRAGGVLNMAARK
jgi:aconitate hydratase